MFHMREQLTYLTTHHFVTALCRCAISCVLTPRVREALLCQKLTLLLIHTLTLKPLEKGALCHCTYLTVKTNQCPMLGIIAAVGQYQRSYVNYYDSPCFHYPQEHVLFTCNIYVKLKKM